MTGDKPNTIALCTDVSNVWSEMPREYGAYMFISKMYERVYKGIQLDGSRGDKYVFL